METLDDVLRYGCMSLLLWLAVLVIRDFCGHIRGRLGAVLAISNIAYLLCSKSAITIFGLETDIVLFPLCFMNGVFAWLFCLSQFDDHFELKSWHWLVLGVKLLAGGMIAISHFRADEPLNVAGNILSGAIVIGTLLHLVYMIWQGRADDLMRTRMKFRSIFVISVVVISLGIMIAEVWLLDMGWKRYLLPLQSASFFCITFFVLWRISGPEGIDLFVFGDAAGGETPKAAPREDRYDLKALEALVASEAYLEPGLTISVLADKLKMPEHRLRRLINQHLGFRNFSDFLNHHRITAAQERLADTDARHVPVLTIAMDLGYGSLGPFNRAFKERTGLTPSEYRRNVLSGAA
ncbi:AraC family transcriptional regulator [Kordiimonas gwangyangensis]|uniref:AraC family transcriptional regulator n=1 Tax=Kordiimonas gwangyangensis TaxID=288022 RepID=UPI0003AA1E63|nr:helix-turn-helix domain-containing protein [Kordiimonas gwangyangensis]